MIEAMKLALEALENNPYALAYSKVITSLRQAIEQAEKQQALDKKAENARELGLDYEPVQAEKQQPFGYLWPTGRHPEFRFTQQLRDDVEGTPVYTTPQPRRKWFGLTPADFDWLEQVFANKVSNDFVFADIVCVISAKLKEKNSL